MAEQVPHTDRPDTKHVHDERDLCPCREEERAKYFSEGCNKHVCSKCSSDHIDHDEKKLHRIIDEIFSLGGRIGHHINKLEGFGEGLKAKEKEMAATEKELCDKIDIQVQNVCDEATRIGQNMKDNVKKTFQHDGENASSGTSDTMNIKKLMEENKTALKDLKKCMETCWTVLEERSSVPMAESLDKLRQEVEDCVSGKMVIPDVPVIEFEAGEIDRGILSKQVGRLVGIGGMFEVWFDVNDISEKGKVYCSREIECEGMTWCVRVYRCSDDGIVWINLQLTKTPQGIESCKVDYCLKLVNIKDDHQSVVDHYIVTITQGELLDDIEYEWRRLTDIRAGFIDDENQFKVEAKLKILQ